MQHYAVTGDATSAGDALEEMSDGHRLDLPERIIWRSSLPAVPTLIADQAASK